MKVGKPSYLHRPERACREAIAVGGLGPGVVGCARGHEDLGLGGPARTRRRWRLHPLCGNGLHRRALCGNGLRHVGCGDGSLGCQPDALPQVVFVWRLGMRWASRLRHGIQRDARCQRRWLDRLGRRRRLADRCNGDDSGRRRRSDLARGFGRRCRGRIDGDRGLGRRECRRRLGAGRIGQRRIGLRTQAHESLDLGAEQSARRRVDRLHRHPPAEGIERAASPARPAPSGRRRRHRRSRPGRAGH